MQIKYAQIASRKLHNMVDMVDKITRSCSRLGR